VDEVKDDQDGKVEFELGCFVEPIEEEEEEEDEDWN
jgi:hypothetical protein